jgi:Ca2+-binding EF-hand superfamily protein
LTYEDDSSPIEPDLDTYTDFDDFVDYCRHWKPKNKDLKTKFKDYGQDIRGYLEFEALIRQVGNLDTVSWKRLIKEIKRLINIQKAAAEMSVLGIVVNSNRRT